MASSPKIRLRALWFKVHKWLGILLAILIVPLSLTGAALVWHDWLEMRLNPERNVAHGPANLPYEAYLGAARRALQPADRIASMALPGEQGPVVISAVRPAEGGGRPVRTTVWVDPASMDVLDRAGGNEGLVRTLHMLHGTLMVPGWGRQLVGWIGVAMLISSLTGLWLWWPTAGGGVRRGLRWRRQPTTNANLHHMTGFWIALPLAMLSCTGVWISFPGVFGGGAPAPAGRPAAPPLPLEQTRLPAQLAAATASARAGAPAALIAWPTDQAPSWTVSFRSASGTREVKVEDRTGAVSVPPPRPETTARTMRRWHDGNGMGPGWQIVVFLGGIAPALLAVTGVIMWLRTRRWRGGAAKPKARTASS
jgi:uncharacterized iron-regulated membrane protein